MKPILLFPGQGAQSVGMGKALYEKYPESRQVFVEASEVLGRDLGRVCFEGPDEELLKTEVTQPAIMAVSLAAWAPLAKRGLEPAGAIGHSLGEVTAWVACGVVDLRTGFEVVRVRAQAMAEVGRRVPGAMAAVIGLPAGKVAELLSGYDPKEVIGANWNAEDQVVLAGKPHAVEEIGKRLKDEGARRVVPLKVAAAFHTPHLIAASETLRAFLDKLHKEGRLKTARAPIYANLDGSPRTEVGTLLDPSPA